MPIASIESIVLAANWIKEAANDPQFVHENEKGADYKHQLAAHFGHLLDEHMGLELGIIRHAHFFKSASRALGSIHAPQFLTLKPLREPSRYNRLDQGYLEMPSTSQPS